MSFAGKHAVVTGGSSGVGAVVALALAEAGAAVTIVGRRADALADVADKHSAIAAYAADVVDRAGLEAGLSAATERSGPIDIMVAAAGASNSKPFHRLTPDDLNELLSVNVLGVFNSFQVAYEATRKSQWGRLIAIASTAGLTGYPYVSHYCASKHAVVGLVRSLAKEAATTGTTVNAVCPSYVDTPMTDHTIDNIVRQTGRTREQALGALIAGNPQGRLITTEEVAAAVLWLCTDAASPINGQAIAVDGGEL